MHKEVPMKKWGALLCFLILAGFRLGAQSNQIIDQLLQEPQASFGDVVYLTMAAVKMVPETATPDQAIQALRQQNWKVQILAPTAPISLGDYSFLLMKAFKVTGGIFYSLFPGPRYACRELGFLKVIPTDARPLRSLSGGEAVRILSNMLALQGGKS
jgi:hypothetical protein